MSTRPAIYLYGERVADRWTAADRRSLLAVADVTIPWGRERITAPPEGHAASVRLLDAGDWAERFAHQTLVGARAEIRREGDGVAVTLLAGVVTDQALRRRRIVDPISRMTRDVIELDLTISDTLAVLNTTFKRGEYPGLQLYGQGGVPTRLVAGPWGRGGWDAKFNPDRLDEIRRIAGSALLPAVVAPRNEFPKPADAMNTALVSRPIQAGVPSTALVSLGTLLARVYAAAEGLGWARIRPGVGAEQGRPQTAGAIALRHGTTADAEVFIEPADTSVPASVLGLDDPDLFPSASLDDRVASIVLAIERHKYGWQEALRDSSTGAELRPEQLIDDDDSDTRRAAVNLASLSTGEVELDAGASADRVSPNSQTNTATNLNQSHWAASWNAGLALVEEAAARAEALNDWLRLPPLRYRPRGTDTEIDALLQTWDTDAIHLYGSQWAGVARVPRTVQFIGGTLAWDEHGWTHDLIPAPTIDRQPRALSVAALDLPNPFNAVRADVTFNALAAISERKP